MKYTYKLLTLIIYIIAMSDQSFLRKNSDLMILRKTESNVINFKGTEKPFTGKYAKYSRRKVHMYANSAALLFITQLISLNLIAAGQASTMR